MRILIVEDEKRIQDFLSRGLESAGYAVDVAGDGATAMELQLLITALGQTVSVAFTRKQAWALLVAPGRPPAPS